MEEPLTAPLHGHSPASVLFFAEMWTVKRQTDSVAEKYEHQVRTRVWKVVAPLQHATPHQVLLGEGHQVPVQPLEHLRERLVQVGEETPFVAEEAE